MLIYAFIYFILLMKMWKNRWVVLCFFFFFWNLIRMKTLQFKNLFGRFFYYLDDILFIVTETDFDI